MPASDTSFGILHCRSASGTISKSGKSLPKKSLNSFRRVSKNSWCGREKPVSSHQYLNNNRMSSETIYGIITLISSFEFLNSTARSYFCQSIYVQLDHPLAK